MRLTVCILVLIASCVLAKKSNYWWMFPKFDEHSPDHQLESVGVPDNLDESLLLNNVSQPYLNLEKDSGSYNEKEQNGIEIGEEEEDDESSVNNEHEVEYQDEEGALALNEELDDADLDLDQDEDKEDLLIMKENEVVDWKDLLSEIDEPSHDEKNIETQNAIEKTIEEDESSEEKENLRVPMANKEEPEENATEANTKMAVENKLQDFPQKAIKKQEGSDKEMEGSGENPEDPTTDDEEIIKSGQVETRLKPETAKTDMNDDEENREDDKGDKDDDEGDNGDDEWNKEDDMFYNVDYDENNESEILQDVTEPVKPISPTVRLDLEQIKEQINIETVQPLEPEFQQPSNTICDLNQSPLIPLAEPKFITELPGTDSLLLCRLMPGESKATLPAFRVTWKFEKSTCPKVSESGCRIVLNTTTFNSPTEPSNLTYVVPYTILQLNHSDVGEYTCEVDFYGCPLQTSVNATRITSQPINVRLYEKPNYAVHIGVILAACVILVAILTGLCYFVWNREKKKEGNYKMLLATTNVEYAPASKMLQPPNSVYNPTTTNTDGFTRMSASSFGSKSSFSSNEEFQEP